MGDEFGVDCVAEGRGAKFRVRRVISHFKVDRTLLDNDQIQIPIGLLDFL